MDGRIHPVVVDRGLGRHHRRDQAPREQAGFTGLRVGSAVGHLEVDDGWGAGGHRERVVPEAHRDRRLCGSAAGWNSSAPVTEREPVAVSPARLAEDRGTLDDRDLPSRTDTMAAALSGVIGGPVGRHALIGRARFLTPLRVMLIIALVFLALGYSTKAACLQTTGTGT